MKRTDIHRLMNINVSRENKNFSTQLRPRRVFLNFDLRQMELTDAIPWNWRVPNSFPPESRINRREVEVPSVVPPVRKVLPHDPSSLSTVRSLCGSRASALSLVSSSGARKGEQM